MTDTTQPARKQRKLEYIHRMRLKDGQHIENDQKGQQVTYSRGDVFLSTRPLYKRWPEKFELVPDYTPLSGGGAVIHNDDYDPDFDDPQEFTSTVPTAPMPNPQSPRPTSQPPHHSRRHELMDDKMLDSMTVNELKALAEEEEIPLEGATKKPEIVEAIKKSR